MHRPNLPVRSAFPCQVGQPCSIRRPDWVGVRARAGCQLCSAAAIGVHNEDLALGQVAGWAGDKCQLVTTRRPRWEVLFRIARICQVVWRAAGVERKDILLTRASGARTIGQCTVLRPADPCHAALAGRRHLATRQLDNRELPGRVRVWTYSKCDALAIWRPGRVACFLTNRANLIKI